MKILDWLERKLKQRHRNLGGEYYQPVNFDGAWVARDVVDKGRDVVNKNPYGFSKDILHFRAVATANRRAIDMIRGNKYKIGDTVPSCEAEYSTRRWSGITGSYQGIDEYFVDEPDDVRALYIANKQIKSYVVCAYCGTRNKFNVWNCSACGAPILEE